MSFERQRWLCKDCGRTTNHHVKPFGDRSGKPEWVAVYGVRAFERNKFCENVESHRIDFCPITTCEVVKENLVAIIEECRDAQKTLELVRLELEKARSEILAHRAFRDKIRLLTDEAL